MKIGCFGIKVEIEETKVEKNYTKIKELIDNV
jgi:hypothetical protein